MAREPPHGRTFAAVFFIKGCPRMIVRGIPRPWGRLPPAVGQVSHVLRTRLPLNRELPPGPVRLTCVRHAASVRPEPGSNSPMIGKFEQLTERLVHLSSESQSE